MREDRLSISALANIAKEQPETLQLHVNKIVCLEFFADDAVHHKLFQDVKFPKLESLVLDASDDNREALLEPYLVPSLKRLLFFGGPISDTFLEKLQESCPHLEELLIDNPRDLITPGGFLWFLDGVISLKHLTVMFGMDRVITDSVFMALTTKPGLESLGLRKLITTKLVSRAFIDEQVGGGARGRPFPHLRKLICAGEADGIEGLLPHLSQLTHLEVSIGRSSDPLNEAQDLLPNINIYCSSLRSLKLEYSDGEDIQISLLSLVKLTQGMECLEELIITNEKVKVEGFDDSHFISIIQTLPRLEKLQLSFDCDLTETALLQAARSCGTNLAKLEIWGHYNLRNITGCDAALPNLRSLVLGRLMSPSPVADPTASEVVDVVQLLKKLAPRLEEFDVVLDSLFSDMVREELGK